MPRWRAAAGSRSAWSTSTTRPAAWRARLETHVVTEDQTFTVPVRRQEVRLVHDAVPVDEQVGFDTEPSETVHEVVRCVEQVLITTRIVRSNGCA